MLGCDIIEIERVRAAAERESFFKGVFTENERAYYTEHGKRAQTLAGMFCAKEAVAKALKSGFRGFRPCDIEILHAEGGAPTAKLVGRAKELFPAAVVEISVSHCESYAMAVAIVQ